MSLYEYDDMGVYNKRELSTAGLVKILVMNLSAWIEVLDFTWALTFF